MDKDLDALLSTPLLEAPDDFTQRVMQRVQFIAVSRRRPGLLEKLQDMALVVGGILGATQVAAFIFGIWAASAAV